MFVRAKYCSVVGRLAGWLASNYGGDEEAQVGDAGLRKCWRKLGVEEPEWRRGGGREGEALKVGVLAF